MFDKIHQLWARAGSDREVCRMICGLGNPGPRYAHTRHNAGFLALERIAGGGAGWRKEKAGAEVLLRELEGQAVILVKPLTYMNLSGHAVKPLMKKYGMTPDRLLVISDDLDLPFGTLRLRPGGGAGGQKGVQSIIDNLGTREFARLRIGIGRPPEGCDPADYVLSPFPFEDRERLELVLEQAREAALCWLSRGIEEAMNRYNRCRV